MNNSVLEKWRHWFTQHKRNRVVTLFPDVHNGKYVLISYLTDPYFLKTDISRHTHSNLIECKTVVNFFLNKGYIVDVINWDNNIFIPSRKYAVIFDIHNNIDRLSNYLPKDTIKVLYATGAHWLFQNLAEYQRLDDLKKRRGLSLIPRRQTPPCQSAEKSDHLIILGKRTAYNSFLYTKKSLHSINLFSILTVQLEEEKDFHKSRNNFLWIGNAGLVHKGLDLVLEAFSKLPTHHLYICGNISDEKDFEDAYYQELYNTPNIHTVGWMDIHSSQFQELLKNCIALVYPSCSEGQSGSVITCMHGGLIPIISEYCGISIQNNGVILEVISIENIRESVRMVSSMDVKELETKTKESRNYILREHTLEKYQKDMNMVLDLIINRNN